MFLTPAKQLNLLTPPIKINNNPKAFDLLCELLNNFDISQIKQALNIHQGTIKRWFANKEVPDNYFNDLNYLLKNKYPSKNNYRKQDQFYTKPHIAKYCYQQTLKILDEAKIDIHNHIFIEPSAGCGSFFNILPSNKRIGIDLHPACEFASQLIAGNYLSYLPSLLQKYVVIGNPPFGLRGNLALRFILHSQQFADVVAFILPPLFHSTGKGSPMKRIDGYQLLHSEKLPLNSFQYPSGTNVDIATIFQVWVKPKLISLPLVKHKTCKTIANIYSLSDGGTPGSTRNKKMINNCHIYLPSTCFSGMKAYKNFSDLPNKRGYGLVFLQHQQELIDLFHTINWQEVAFLSTNSALNLRTDLIMQQLINNGFYDKEQNYQKPKK